MNILVNKIVNALVEYGIIKKDKTDDYKYGVEVLFIKILGFLTICIVGIITKKYIETLVFYFTFTWLRTYTNGYHSKNYITCLVASASLYTLICTIISVLLSKYIFMLNLISYIAMLIIYILSPLNTVDIMLREHELIKHKKIIKFLLLIYSVILFMFINFKVENTIVMFFDIAIILDMLLLIVGKIMSLRNKV